jgi:hypothetical protein
MSKDLQGQAETVDVAFRSCGNPPCDTMTMVQRLEVTTQPGPCDSTISSFLEGSIGIRLITTFAFPSEWSRGVHAADIGWLPSTGGNVTGKLHGLTNVGIVRLPHLHDCEPCLTQGLLTGLLTGSGSGVSGLFLLEVGVVRRRAHPDHSGPDADGSHVHCCSVDGVRCPALPLRPHRGNARRRRRPSHDLPDPTHKPFRQFPAPHDVWLTPPRTVTHRTPAHIHRVRAGRRSRGFTTPVPRVHLPVSLTRHGPSGSTEPP